MKLYLEKEEESRLFKIVNRVLEWHGVKKSERLKMKEDIADLVMRELINY